MAIASRILILLITLRLLMPSGICICKLSSPAVAWAAHLAGQPAPADDDHDHDDHAPGCPASPLAVGMGLIPASPGIDAPALCLPVPPFQLDPVSAPEPIRLARLDYLAAPPPGPTSRVLLI